MWLIGLSDRDLCLIAQSGSLWKLYSWQVRPWGLEPILSATKPSPSPAHWPLVPLLEESLCTLLNPDRWLGHVCLCTGASLPALLHLGPTSRSHLCYSTDSSVCPSKARTIKGSFQSHCRRNVNTKGRPAVVSEVECHLWAASRAAGRPGAWSLDLLLPQTCCAIFGIFLTFSGPCFYH